MLSTLDGGLVAGLVVAACVRFVAVAASVGVLPTLHLGFMAGFIVLASVRCFCHRYFSFERDRSRAYLPLQTEMQTRREVWSVAIRYLI